MMPTMERDDLAEALELGQDLAWEHTREVVRHRYPALRVLKSPVWQRVQGGWGLQFQADGQNIVLAPWPESLLMDAPFEPEGPTSALWVHAEGLLDRLTGGEE